MEFQHIPGDKFCNPETGSIIQAVLFVSDQFVTEQDMQDFCTNHNTTYKHIDGFYYVFSKEDVK